MLKNPELETLFAGQGLWDTLSKIIGPDAPDLGRIVDRGQNGIHLLDWLADSIPQLNSMARHRPLLSAQSPVFGWAATWLRATGIEMASPASPIQGVV